MRAIILAAGRGTRLLQSQDEHIPKVLLRFGGMTLLERHLRLLRAAGVADVVIATGFRHDLVAAEIDRLDWRPRPRLVLNPGFESGSMLTVHAASAAFAAADDVLLMDADVLYDGRMAKALVAGDAPVNRVLMDRGFEPGIEPVKICVSAGLPVELRKQLPPDLRFDTIGESVGFFRFHGRALRRLIDLVAEYVETGHAHLPHEEAVRDVLLDRGHAIEVVDVTGNPWIEIDFQTDVTRAESVIFPLLQPVEPVEG